MLFIDYSVQTGHLFSETNVKSMDLRVSLAILFEK